MPRDPVFDRYYMEGFTLAEDDYDGDVNRWKGVVPVVDNEVDVDDLAAQCIASDRSAAASTAIVQKAVADYMAKVTRSNNVEKIFQKQLGPDVPDRYQPTSFAAWKTGYEVALFGKIFNAALDRWTEILDEDEDAENAEDDEDEDDELATPVRTNPGGPEPISVWTTTGAQDAGNVLDRDTLEDADIDLENWAQDITGGIAPQKGGEVDPAKVRTAAAEVVTLLLAAVDKKEWIAQHRDNIAELDHLPSEAFRAWQEGFGNVAVEQVARWLEEDHQAYLDEHVR